MSRAHLTEGRRWLARALASPAGPSAAYLKACAGAGWLAHMQHDATAARSRAEEALTLAHILGDTWMRSWALHLLGRIAYFSGDAVTVRKLAEQSLLAAREAGDDWLVAWALHLLGLAAHIAEDYPTARSYYEESQVIRRGLGHLEGIGVCQNLLAMVAYREGAYLEALQLGRAGLLALRQVGQYAVHNALATFAGLAVRLGDPRRAVRLAAATAAFSTLVEIAPIPLATSMLRDVPNLAHQTLDPADYATAWGEGQVLTLDEALAEALALEPPSQSNPATRSTAQWTASADLSPREIEVLREIAAGRTTREVADRLVISARTVERHIKHIYEKVGARGRADATAFALKHGLI